MHRKNVPCSCFMVAWISLMAEYATPLPSKMSNHSLVGFVRVTDSIRPSIRMRFSTRLSFVTKRGSVAHSGWPSFSQRRPNRRLFPPPKRISPSSVLNPEYGTIDAKFCQNSRPYFEPNGRQCDEVNVRCAVPHRPESGFPLIKAELATFVNVATWQSLKATSKCCPTPV